jgi:hypothetical protein
MKRFAVPALLWTTAVAAQDAAPVEHRPSDGDFTLGTCHVTLPTRYGIHGGASLARDSELTSFPFIAKHHCQGPGMAIAAPEETRRFSTLRVQVRPARNIFSNALNFCCSAIAALVRSP